jgi:hypothetical protein
MSHFFSYFLLLPTWEHWADFSVSWSFTDGRTPWTGDQLVARPLPKQRTTQTPKNEHTHQTSMPWVEFEPTIPAFQQAKTVHVSDRSATVSSWDTHTHIRACMHAHTEHWISEWLTNEELESMWPVSRHYMSTCLETLRKTTQLLIPRFKSSISWTQARSVTSWANMFSGKEVVAARSKGLSRILYRTTRKSWKISKRDTLWSVKQLNCMYREYECDNDSTCALSLWCTSVLV